jgi:hypothetical protein
MSSPSMTLTEWPPSSAFARLRLAASRAAAPSIPPWPEPELSIGQPCSLLGSLKCWEAIGPALAISVGILKAVKDLLDPRAEYLHQEESKPCFIAFGVYMIGRDEKRANPTLLISCERKSPRQKAVKIVRESAILRGNAGVRLAESPRPPVCSVSPIQLGLSGDENVKDSFRHLPDDSLYWSPSGTTCGISLYARKLHGSDITYVQKATIGGIVCVQGDFFGVSTAHGFIDDHKPLAFPDDETSFEISFDDWVEGDEMRQDIAELGGRG